MFSINSRTIIIPNHMEIPDHLLKEFKEQYKKDFGEELSEKEALDRFMSVVNVLRIIQKYMPFTLENIEAMPDEKPMKKPSSAPLKRVRKKAGQ